MSKSVLVSLEDAIDACFDLDSEDGLVMLDDVVIALRGLDERGSELSGKWYFDGVTERGSTFRTCSHCGAVYHINSGDDAFKYCPNCSKRMRDA